MLNFWAFYACILICCGRNISAKTNSRHPDGSKITVLTINPDKSLSANDAGSYELKKLGIFGYQVEIIFKEDVKCKEVKYDGNTVWVHDPSTNRRKFPSVVSLNTVAKTLWVENDDLNFYTFHFKDGLWEFKPSLSHGSCSEYIEPTDRPPSVDEDDDLSSESGDEAEERPSEGTYGPPGEGKSQPSDRDTPETGDSKTPYPQPSPEEHGQTPTDATGTAHLDRKHQASGPVSLVIDLDDHKETTDQYVYNKRGHVDTYTANEGFKFLKVLKAGRPIWEGAANRCGSEIQVDYTGENTDRILTYSVAFDDSALMNFVKLNEFGAPLEPHTKHEKTPVKLTGGKFVGALVDVSKHAEPLEVEWNGKVIWKYDPSKHRKLPPNLYLFGDGGSKTTGNPFHTLNWAERTSAETEDATETSAVDELERILFENVETEPEESDVDTPETPTPGVAEETIEAAVSGRTEETEDERTQPGPEGEETQHPAHPPPATAIELDLTTQQSSELYDYTYDSVTQTHTYATKSCFKAVKKETHILKIFDEELPVKLVVGYSEHGDVLLSSYYGDTEDFVFSVLKDPDPSTTLKNVETLSVATTTFTVISGEAYADAIKQTVQQEAPEGTDAGFMDLTNLFNYAFNKDSKCTEVTYGNKTLWKHDRAKHGNHHPTNVLLNMKTKFLLIESEGQYQYFYSYYNGEWRQVFGYQQPEGLQHNKLRFMTVNDYGLNVAMDADAYELKHSHHTYTFTFNNASKCTAVTYDGSSLWKHNPNEHGAVYPTSVTLNTEKNHVLVDSTASYRYLYTYYYGEWRLIFAYKSQIAHPEADKLKLYTLNAEDTPVEVDSTMYDVEGGVLVTYTLKGDARCSSVAYDGKTVWKYDPKEHRKYYPTAVAMHKTKNLVTVDSAGHYRHIYGYYNGDWVELPLGYREWDLQLAKLTLVTLAADLSHKHNDASQYSVESHSNDVAFNFHPGAMCTEVNYEHKAVWKYDSVEHANSYPTTVRMNRKNNNLLVECANKYRYLYNYKDGGWSLSPFGFRARQTCVSNLTIVTLGENDTRVENDASKYDIEQSANIFAFKFHDGTKCTEVIYAGDSVWKHDPGDHGEHYPDTLIFNTATSFLLLDISDNYQISYSYYKDKWNPVFTYKRRGTAEISEEPQELDVDKMSIRTLNDDGTVSENDSTKYDTVEAGGIVTLKFHMGSMCTRVMYESEILWEYHKTTHNSTFPTSVVMNKDLGLFIVESEDHYLYLCEYHKKSDSPKDELRDSLGASGPSLSVDPENICVEDELNNNCETLDKLFRDMDKWLDSVNEKAMVMITGRSERPGEKPKAQVVSKKEAKNKLQEIMFELVQISRLPEDQKNEKLAEYLTRIKALKTWSAFKAQDLEQIKERDDVEHEEPASQTEEEVDPSSLQTVTLSLSLLDRDGQQDVSEPYSPEGDDSDALLRGSNP